MSEPHPVTSARPQPAQLLLSAGQLDSVCDPHTRVPKRTEPNHPQGTPLWSGRACPSLSYFCSVLPGLPRPHANNSHCTLSDLRGPPVRQLVWVSVSRCVPDTLSGTPGSGLPPV